MAGPRFPVRHVPSKGVWEVDVRPHGRIRSVLFPGGTSPVKLIHEAWANEIRTTILRDIAKGVPEEIAVAPYLPRESKLEAWAQKWIEQLEKRVKLEERSPTYTRRLRNFTGDFEGTPGIWEPLYGTSIHALDYGILEDFATDLRLAGRHPTTVVHVLSALQTCLRWVSARTGRVYTPPEFPELKRAKFEPRILTPAEQTTVLESIHLPVRGVFLAMADLMIRPGEGRAAWVEAFDFKTRELRIDFAIQGARKDAPRGPTKGKDRRVLVVTRRLGDWLDEHVSPTRKLQRTGLLFPNTRALLGDHRWSQQTMWEVWTGACAKAGVAPTCPYVGTKHSTSTWLRESGMSLEEIGLAMGHAWARRGAEVTEGYAGSPRVANANIARILDNRRV